jgi:hypothetical protein
MHEVKFLDRGVQLILDDLARHREDPAKTKDALWKVAWARGYQDVLIPVHGSDTRYEGMLALAYGLASKRTVIAIDTGERVLAVVDAFDALPATGSKVRITAIFAGSTEKWVVKPISAIGCGLSVQLGADIGNKRSSDSAWADTLRNALAQARALESEQTKKINAERMALPPVEEEPPFKDQIVKLDEDMRKRISSAPLSPEQEREKSKLRTQEQADAFFVKHKAKIAEQYRAESLVFREKTIPELRAAYDKRAARNEVLGAEIGRVTKLLAENLANVELAGQAMKMIDRIEEACLPIAVGDMSAVQSDSRGHFKEIIETVSQLHEVVASQRPRAS